MYYTFRRWCCLWLQNTWRRGVRNKVIHLQRQTCNPFEAGLKTSSLSFASQIHLLFFLPYVLCLCVCRFLLPAHRWIMMMCLSWIPRKRSTSSTVLIQTSRREPKLWKLFSIWKTSIMKELVMLLLLVSCIASSSFVSPWCCYLK